MSNIITTLHPENDETINLYPNIKKTNIPSNAIDFSKLDNDVKNLLSNIGTLKPSGTDTSTNILAFTTDKGIYIGTDTGHWYYWNGTQYADGGVYQTDLSYEEVKEEIKYIKNDEFTLNEKIKINSNIASLGWDNYVRGNLTNGVVTSLNYRVTSSDIIYSGDYGYYLRCDDGFQMGIHFLDEDGNFLSNKVWYKIVFIPNNSYYRIVIKRESETTTRLTDSEVVDFVNSLNVVYRENEIDTKENYPLLWAGNNSSSPLVAYMNSSNDDNYYCTSATSLVFPIWFDTEDYIEVDLSNIKDDNLSYWKVDLVPLTGFVNFCQRFLHGEAKPDSSKQRLNYVKTFDGRFTVSKKSLLNWNSAFTNILGCSVVVSMYDNTNTIIDCHEYSNTRNVILKRCNFQTTENYKPITLFNGDYSVEYREGIFIHSDILATNGCDSVEILLPRKPDVDNGYFYKINLRFYNNTSNVGIGKGMYSVSYARSTNDYVISEDDKLLINGLAGFSAFSFSLFEQNSQTQYLPKNAEPNAGTFCTMRMKYNYPKNAIEKTSGIPLYSIDQGIYPTNSGIIANTIQAFYTAYLQNAECIETDARLSSDGVFFCSHDPSVTGEYEGVTSTFVIAETSSEILKNVVLGNNEMYGDMKLTPLEDALKFCYDKGIMINIDLKLGTTGLTELIALIKKCGMLGKVIYAPNDYLEVIPIILEKDKNANFVLALGTSSRVEWTDELRNICYVYLSIQDADVISEIESVRNIGCKLMLTMISTPTYFSDALEYCPECIQFHGNISWLCEKVLKNKSYW